ncbi:MAG TPA: alpha-galactosidase, partial [Bacillota bacterium]|nr:alpha-galactosidase [Bacillota bacterium]
TAVDQEKIMAIARAARELGIELFVLDDGWFGQRDNDRSSLGDWVVNRTKLREGLSGLAKAINGLGMGFGLWVEPEMVSPDSDLYRSHPDWCLHLPERERIQTRSQLILDLSRLEVCEAIYTMIGEILKSAPITYVKWDMNRNMSDVGSAALPPERQRETAHRYMLGLYRLLERLTTEFPEVLFESCSGGGGRFDPGMLYYMPQTWTSDDTDAVERLKIQYGTSIVYPSVTMGAHVSAVPNHQLGRVTPLETRGHAAMSGNFGYELDLTKLTASEGQSIREQVDVYQGIRRLVQFGDFYRLLTPFAGDRAAWMFRAKDGSKAVVFYFHILAQPNAPDFRLKLEGLDSKADYRVEGYERLFGGDELMNVGIPVGELKDFSSLMLRIQRI